MKLFKFLIISLVAFPAYVCAVPTRTPVIQNPFIVFYQGETPGAGYMTIHQTAAENDQLLAVRLDKQHGDQGRIELHDHVSKKINGQDVKKMMVLQAVDIPASEQKNHGIVSFASGGKHLMLYDFPQSFKKLKKITLVLVFKKAGNIAVEFKIRDPSTLSEKGDCQNKCSCNDHKD